MRPTRRRIWLRRIGGVVFTGHWHSVPGLGAGAVWNGGGEPEAAGEWADVPELEAMLGIATPPPPRRAVRYRFLRIGKLEVRWQR